MVHGLEGSSASGYAREHVVYAALEAGYATHRVNLRSCGGTESLALTNYHSGQTSDVLFFLRELKRSSDLPIYLAGFSLGGNVSLKLAGELGTISAGRDPSRRRLRRLHAHRPHIASLRRRALGRRQEFYL